MVEGREKRSLGVIYVDFIIFDVTDFKSGVIFWIKSNIRKLVFVRHDERGSIKKVGKEK